MGALSSLMLHSSFSLGAFSGVISVSLLFQPVRCGSPPNVGQTPRVYCAFAAAAVKAARHKTRLVAADGHISDVSVSHPQPHSLTAVIQAAPKKLDRQGS